MLRLYYSTQELNSQFLCHQITEPKLTTTLISVAEEALGLIRKRSERLIEVIHDRPGLDEAQTIVLTAHTLRIALSMYNV